MNNYNETKSFYLNKSNLLKMKQIRGTDELSTPKEAVLPLLSYLNKDWIIWECAWGGGILAKHLREEGYNAVGDRDDFFNPTLQWTYDCIVTNPPFSLKDKFLEKCYELGKPFALLLPITALEGIKRQKLYKKYGLQIIFLPKRIDFTGKKAPWFAVAWFTYKLNLQKDLIF